MGSPSDEAGRLPDEGPQMRVTISKPFWLGATEVTQKQWTTVMGANPSKFNGGDLPVEQVSWNEAVEFCRKLNERASQALPAGYAFMLPTEAQWEYACRAGTTSDKRDEVDAMAWYGQQNGLGTHPVGTKRANAWGLYDMLGNVWEWCRDWKATYPGGSVRDYAGPSTGNVRVMRGGRWGDQVQSCRSAHRGAAAPDSRSYTGFRVALCPVH
jgi:formylglycine-generating enzyme required for sulfatase activity